MTTERVFTVAGAAARPAQPVTLADAGLKERSDLQEWVLAHPEILGPNVLVVAFEFNKWKTTSGSRPLDRLDVLGLDTDGRLVVAELKRDRAPDTVEMQAVKYAAMVSRFTEEDVLDQYVRLLQQQSGHAVDAESAREQLVAHAGELDVAQLRRPRIVLVAGAFPPVVTACTVWLSEMGLDVTLQRVQAYRVFDDRVLVTVSQLYPIPDVEDFTVSPQRAEAKAAVVRRQGRRERSTVLRLVDLQVIPDGTALTLSPTTEVTAEVRQQVADWVAVDPRRGHAVWHNDRSKPLEWEADGVRYRPTEIITRILHEAAEVDRSARGPSWWVLDDGRDLPTVAGAADRGGFDWSGLHALLDWIPSGRWTTYGDLAGAVGTAPQPLGQHVTNCEDCSNAFRVLGADGRPREGFSWGDPDRTETQQAVLESEGVAFSQGKADARRRVPAEQLADQLSD